MLLKSIEHRPHVGRLGDVAGHDRGIHAIAVADLGGDRFGRLCLAVIVDGDAGPSAANARQMALPRPWAAPVTKAILSFRPRSMESPSLRQSTIGRDAVRPIITELATGRQCGRFGVRRLVAAFAHRCGRSVPPCLGTLSPLRRWAIFMAGNIPPSVAGPPMDFHLAEKVAIVTGGSRGSGRAICRVLAAEGARVAVNYRRQQAEAAELVGEIRQSGGQATAVAADVSRSADVVRLFDAVEAELGPVEILVNNAGVWPKGYVQDITEEDWDRTMTINLKGPFLTCREAVRSLARGPARRSHREHRLPGRLPGLDHRSCPLCGIEGRAGRASPSRWPGKWPRRESM